MHQRRALARNRALALHADHIEALGEEPVSQVAADKPGDAGDDDEHPERNVDVDAAEVVLSGSSNLDAHPFPSPPAAAAALIVEDGATADYLRMVLSELSLRGSYLGFNEAPQAIELMAHGVIRSDIIVTNVVDGIERAIERVFPSLGKPDNPDGKVVVRIGGDG